MDTINTKKVFALIICSLFLSSCGILGSKSSNTGDSSRGDWKTVATFGGDPRDGAVAFTINGKGYLGTGYNGTKRLNDFWQFDPVKNWWTQKASLPGVVRSSAVGFVANGMGYIGTGYNPDVTGNYLKDFWKYDPTTNNWTQIADYAGGARYGAVAFSINNIGYVGTGNNDKDLQDFWSYNSQTDKWTQVVSLPGEKRMYATAFVIGGLGYVGTGIDNGAYQNDFWSYDPVSGLWKRLQNLDQDANGNSQAIPRSNAVAFSLNGKGYITLGAKSGLLKDVWEYTPSTDTWVSLHDFEGTARESSVVFSIDSLAYVGTGTDGTVRYDDIWQFDPTVANNASTY